MIDLKKQIIVVVGGNGLLGGEFVKSISTHNGICLNADITNEEKDNKYKVDITSEKSVEKLIKNIHNKYGKIDAVINSAYPRNKNYGKSFFEIKYSDFCENLNLHLGVVLIINEITIHVSIINPDFYIHCNTFKYAVCLCTGLL